MTQAPGDQTEERIRVLEETLAGLRAEIDGYREMFLAAARSPVARQAMAAFGIKLPAKLEPDRLNPPGRV